MNKLDSKGNISNKIIPMEIMGEIIKEQLKLGGNVKFTPKGISMLPMLRNNVDVVVLERPDGKLKKYDLPLYQRENGKYILHRVIKVMDDGSYIMCGDNQVLPEHGITDDNIVGIVTEFQRKGKYYSTEYVGYKIYCWLWITILPVRRCLKNTRRLLGRIKRKFVRIIRKMF